MTRDPLPLSVGVQNDVAKAPGAFSSSGPLPGAENAGVRHARGVMQRGYLLCALFSACRGMA